MSGIDDILAKTEILEERGYLYNFTYSCFWHKDRKHVVYVEYINDSCPETLRTELDHNNLYTTEVGGWCFYLGESMLSETILPSYAKRFDELATESNSIELNLPEKEAVALCAGREMQRAAKVKIIEERGYQYDWPHAVYWHKDRRQIISKQYIDEASPESLKTCIDNNFVCTSKIGGWHFYTKAHLTDSALSELTKVFNELVKICDTQISPYDHISGPVFPSGDQVLTTTAPEEVSVNLRSWSGDAEPKASVGPQMPYPVEDSTLVVSFAEALRAATGSRGEEGTS